jgi:hypothetical protein
MDANKREWLMKNCCWRSTRPKAVLAVGLQAEALLQCFLLATTARKFFRSLLISAQIPVIREKMIPNQSL